MRIVSSWSDNNTITFIVRDGDKKTRKDVDSFQHYFLIETKDRVHPAIDEFLRRKTLTHVEELGRFTKLYLKTARHFYWARDKLEKLDIKTYESDVPFTRRYMIDRQVIIGDDPLRILYVDIETDDSRRGIVVGRDTILSIGCIDQAGKKRFFLNADHKNSDCERTMIRNFIEAAREYDVLVAWNGYKFDFPYLEERSKWLGIRFNWRYFQKVDLMLKFIKMKRLKSYSLGNVGEVEVGEKKLDVKKKIIDIYLEDKGLLMAYNMQDVLIMMKLDEKYEITKLLDVMSTKTNCFVEELSFPTIIVDNCILRKVKENKLNIWFPYMGKRERTYFEGGFVQEPPPGLHRNVLTVDFTSLYNRIMQSWNISPETLRKGERKIYVPNKEEVWFSQDTIGVIPQIIKGLEDDRNYYKKKRNQYDKGSELWKKYDMLQETVKIILLSFYGVLGNPTSRYYDVDIAGSITGIARWLIKISKQFIEDKGYQVIYIDTDSLFIKIEEDNLDKQIEIGNNICDDLNNFYMKLLGNFKIDPERRRIEMKFEKVVKQIIFVGDKDKGIKKRYAGVQTWDEGKKIEPRFFAKGIEIVRTDWSGLAQRIQRTILDMIFEGKKTLEIYEYLMDKRNLVQGGKMTKDDLTIHQRITKEPKEYKTKVPHVRVVEQMRRDGIEVWVGQKIPYIYIKGAKGKEPIYAEYYKEGYDEYYYWNNKIYPPTDRILKSVFPDYGWETLFLKKERKRKKKTVTE